MINDESQIGDLFELISEAEKKIAKKQASQNNSLHDSVSYKVSLKVLDELVKIFQQSQKETEIQSKLTDFLKTHWEATKGTYLCYTAQQNSELTKICCKIANYLASIDGKKSAIHFLMPDIKYTNNYIEDEDIKDVDLEKVIKTHILSENGETLIPIKLLTNIRLNELDVNNIYINPFIFNKIIFKENEKEIKKTQSVPLSKNEIHRLNHFSEMTENLVSSWENYQKAIKENKTLFSAIHRSTVN